MREIKRTLVSGVGLAALLLLTEPGTAADLPTAMSVKALPIYTSYDWTGFYVGGHIGYAWGNSDWTANTTAAVTPSISGSIDLFQPFDQVDGRLQRGS
jgi:opacity protein-like surface antigen